MLFVSEETLAAPLTGRALAKEKIQRKRDTKSILLFSKKEKATNKTREGCCEGTRVGFCMRLFYLLLIKTGDKGHKKHRISLIFDFKSIGYNQALLLFSFHAWCSCLVPLLTKTKATTYLCAACSKR